MNKIIIFSILISTSVYASTATENTKVYYTTNSAIPAQKVILQTQPGVSYQTVVSPSTKKLYVLVPASTQIQSHVQTQQILQQQAPQNAYIESNANNTALASQPSGYKKLAPDASAQQAQPITYKTSTTITPEPQNQVYFQPHSAPQTVLTPPVIYNYNHFVIAKGIRVYAAKGGYEAELNVDPPFNGLSVKGNVDHDYSLYIGYISVSANQFGYDAGFTHSEFDNGLFNNKIDGNLIYGFSPVSFGKAGINVSEFDGLKGDFDPKFGFQVGVGIQPTGYFGFGITYIETNNEWSDQGRESDLKFRGIEFSVSGTF